ncbi:hypothetical protein F5141DRAFT_1108633, partial [Pisolithus sp. B1]
DRISVRATTNLDGMIAVIDPKPSWVGLWQRTCFAFGASPVVVDRSMYEISMRSKSKVTFRKRSSRVLVPSTPRDRTDQD